MHENKATTIGRPRFPAGQPAARQPRLGRCPRLPGWWAVEGVVGLVVSLSLLVAPPAALAAGGATPQEVPESRGQDGRLRRVALVVGNDAYDSLRPLGNAVNDARVVAAALRDVGFRVTKVTDGTRKELGSALVEFLNDVGRGDVAVFYFAGHGVQVDQENYLVSTDHAGVSEAEIRLNALSVARVATELSRQADLAILVLDACRNNPFPTRSTSSQGLVEMTAPQRTVIAYAAGAGETADDGEPGGNGLFTAEFVKALRVPGLEAVDLFRDVARDVNAASNGRQRPALYLDVLTDFVLHPDVGSSRVFRDCVGCPEMVALPAGRLGGAADSGVGRADNEGARGVEIGPFALSKYEVTFEEYERFVGAMAGRRMPSDGGWGRGRRPVINVSWSDAAAYAEWLSEVTGEEYRLPNELEWEYAARAATTTRYSWGGRAHCSDCGGDWERRTAPVGQFASNAWGLHDTAGNVWEWVADCWREGESGRRRESAGGDCRGRVARGGSWTNGAEYIGPGARTSVHAGHRHRAYGFRVARSLEQEVDGVGRD